jgi:hypothetical protein
MATMTAPRRTNRKPAAEPHGVCRLTLTINGVDYALRRIPADPSIALKAWRLRKPDGTVHHVAVTPHGPTCTCGDFEFRREGIDPAGCKHIRSLNVVGLLALN